MSVIRTLVPASLNTNSGWTANGAATIPVATATNDSSDARTVVDAASFKVTLGAA